MFIYGKIKHSLHTKLNIYRYLFSGIKICFLYANFDISVS